jgi:hypothetical protein
VREKSKRGVWKSFVPVIVWVEGRGIDHKAVRSGTRRNRHRRHKGNRLWAKSCKAGHGSRESPISSTLTTSRQMPAQCNVYRMTHVAEPGHPCD